MLVEECIPQGYVASYSKEAGTKSNGIVAFGSILWPQNVPWSTSNTYWLKFLHRFYSFSY